MPKWKFAAARVNNGMTQDDVCESLNISKSTLVKWEKGETYPNAIKLRQLSELYHIPMDMFYLGE